MNKMRLTLNALAFVILTLTVSSLAQAQATRTWVSGVGDDANPCSRTAPCKTFAGAISKTAINGEIDALDAGGFGAVTAIKSITIDGNGFGGGILASGTNGVNVNIAAGNANDPFRRVTLRRIAINGTGLSGSAGTSTGVRGVNATNFTELNVENCLIQNFTTAGIDINVNEGAGMRVSIKDTNISNTVVGVQGNQANGVGFITLSADKLRVDKCTSGVIAKDRAFFIIRDSVIQACVTVGASIQAPSNSAQLSLDSTVLFSDGTGVQAGGPGTKVDLSNCNISSNMTGVSSGGGQVNSHGNNSFGLNASDGVALNGIGQK